MLDRHDPHSTRDLRNPFRARPSGCVQCGRYVHPLPLGTAAAECPDCRHRVVRGPSL